MAKRKSNRKIKQSQRDSYGFLFGLYVGIKDKTRSDWAFDRLRLYEDNDMHRTKLRNSHISKASITASELRVE